MKSQSDVFKVMVDWFLGDAKEINDTQKEMTDHLSGVGEQLNINTQQLSETAESLSVKLVEAQRAYIASQKDDIKLREEFLIKFQKAQRLAADAQNRQLLIMSAGSSLVGAAIGAVITIMYLK